MIRTFSKWSSQLRITVDTPLSAGKITIEVSYCNFFKILRSFLDRLSWWSLEFRSVRLILAQIVSASSFSRSSTAYSIVAMISLLGSVLQIIETLRSFARRLVPILVNYLEDILITHFLCIMLVALCVTLLLLIFREFLLCYFIIGILVTPS